MPYRLLNIGQLLFLLPNPELKQKVRILEKLNKRFINAKIGTIFNRTYIYIYIGRERVERERASYRCRDLSYALHNLFNLIFIFYLPKNYTRNL